jgi:hypothetical protein
VDARRLAELALAMDQTPKVERWRRRPRARSRALGPRPQPRRANASAPAERDWAKKVAQGDFEGVLREAKQLGHTRVLASAQLADLTRAGRCRPLRGQDRARQADALLSLRARFPEADMARDLGGSFSAASARARTRARAGTIATCTSSHRGRLCVAGAGPQH